MKLILMVVFVIQFIFCYTMQAQHPSGGEAYPELITHPEALKGFQDMRFGMFIHWGPVALRGTEIGWSRGKEVPIKEYDNLYKEFNPVLFNAEEWVKTAKDAGMKYLVITTKHHDGFCLWDSKYTEYDIMSTPYKKDILKELSEACKKQGIIFCAYYSIADWSHPHYATRYGGDKRAVEESDMSIYYQYMKNQLKELIDNYDPALIWFDGGWEDAYTHKMGMDLYAYLRALKPSILINNRVDKGLEGMTGKTKSRKKFAGDYETPEQRVGAFDIEYPWETCMTICKQWAWKPNDKMKPLKECIHTLLKATGGGGNFLFNVGPMADGRIEQRQIDRLKEMGDWLKVNGEAVYGTRGGPYKPTDYMVSTRKENKIYIHLLEKSKTNLKLPFPKGVKIKKAYLLDGTLSVSFNQNKEAVDININGLLPDNIATVLVLETNKPTNNIKVIERFNY